MRPTVSNNCIGVSQPTDVLSDHKTPSFLILCAVAICLLLLIAWPDVFGVGLATLVMCGVFLLAFKTIRILWNVAPGKREFGWFLLTLVIVLYPYHMITNPDCFPDDGESVAGCEGDSLEANIAAAGLVVFVLSLIIIGVTGSEEDNEFFIDDDEKWWIMLGVALTGWICYWIVSSLIGSEFGSAIGEMFAINPFLMSCMTIGLIVLIVISDWSEYGSGVSISQKEGKSSDGTETSVGGGNSKQPKESTKSTQNLKASSNLSKHACANCGKDILSNHGVAKATKVAVYTPITTYLGATIGMALGGFPGLFIVGLVGGASGVAKATEEKSLCFDCRHK